MTRDAYNNGYRFGTVYGFNYGKDSLLRAVRQAGADNGRAYVKDYVAGMVDAALVLVQRGAA